MVQYLTYEEYTALGGTLSVADFPVAELKARKRIDYLTDSRVVAMEEVPEEVKLCEKMLIDAESVYGIESRLSNPLVASFNTDGYSESYGSAAEQQAAAEELMNAKTRELLYGVLDDYGVPLLYRGLS